MVGRLNLTNDFYYDASSNLEPTLKKQSFNGLNLINSVTDRLNTLDSKWFAALGIPTVTFSTGKHVDYHKISDDIKYINMDGMLKIEWFILSWLQELKV